MNGERFTPQEAMFSRGVELAWDANAAYNRMQAAGAMLVAVYEVERTGLVVDEVVRNDLEQTGIETIAVFNAFYDAAEPLIGRTAFDDFKDSTLSEEIDAMTATAETAEVPDLLEQPE